MGPKKESRLTVPDPDPEERVPQPGAGVAKVGEEKCRATGHHGQVLGDEQPGRRSLVVPGIKLARSEDLGVAAVAAAAFVTVVTVVVVTAVTVVAVTVVAVVVVVVVVVVLVVEVLHRAGVCSPWWWKSRALVVVLLWCMDLSS